MKSYDHLKSHFEPYKGLNLSKNPFGISPLFRDFKVMCGKPGREEMCSTRFPVNIRLILLANKNPKTSPESSTTSGGVPIIN